MQLEEKYIYHGCMTMKIGVTPYYNLLGGFRLSLLLFTVKMPLPRVILVNPINRNPCCD